MPCRKRDPRVYRLLKYGAEYICQEMEAYETTYRKRLGHMSEEQVIQPISRVAGVLQLGPDPRHKR
jgi:hypothetical protein